MKTIIHFEPHIESIFCKPCYSISICHVSLASATLNLSFFFTKPLQVICICFPLPKALFSFTKEAINLTHIHISMR